MANALAVSSRKGTSTMAFVKPKAHRLYFAYGSNLSIGQMARRTGNASIKPVMIAYMPDAEICFPRPARHWKGSSAGFIEAKGHRLWGAVFELTSEQEKRLDMMEGVSEGNYTKIEGIGLCAEDGSRIKRSIFTYKANVKHDELKPPSLEYLQEIRKGAMECGLPSEYIEELEAIIKAYYPYASS